LFTYTDVNNSSCYFLFSAALEAASLSYLKAHFTDGVTSVFSPKDGSGQYVIQIVANKYNPTNFWSVAFTGYNFNIDLLVGQDAGDQNILLI
jgi:capping protein alpha